MVGATGRGDAETRRRLYVFVIASLCFVSQAQAQAQSPARLPPGRVEVAVGLGIIGGAGLGGVDANLRSTTGADFQLFNADSSFGRARMLEARAGLELTRRYAVEVRFGVSHPELRTAISDDVEGAPDVTLIERIDQYMVDAALRITLDRFRIGGLEPFATAGAGYLRQLHEGLTLVEEGTLYHVGGGVRQRLVSRARGVLKGIGLRGDLRLYLLSGGVGVGDSPRPHLAAAGSVFVAF